MDEPLILVKKKKHSKKKDKSAKKKVKERCDTGNIQIEDIDDLPCHELDVSNDISNDNIELAEQESKERINEMVNSVINTIDNEQIECSDGSEEHCIISYNDTEYSNSERSTPPPLSSASPFEPEPEPEPEPEQKKIHLKKKVLVKKIPEVTDNRRGNASLSKTQEHIKPAPISLSNGKIRMNKRSINDKPTSKTEVKEITDFNSFISNVSKVDSDTKLTDDDDIILSVMSAMNKDNDKYEENVVTTGDMIDKLERKRRGMLPSEKRDKIDEVISNMKKDYIKNQKKEMDEARAKQDHVISSMEKISQEHLNDIISLDLQPGEKLTSDPAFMIWFESKFKVFDKLKEQKITPHPTMKNPFLASGNRGHRSVPKTIRAMMNKRRNM